ncbi:hypothetical protein BRAS3843_1610028 [Bradyrhizobium sp. STM 3843]|nr:hypothetical protein BRAS3843_1610028 [Bradyrhizobium sp. STM 3843]
MQILRRRKRFALAEGAGVDETLYMTAGNTLHHNTLRPPLFQDSDGSS